MVITISCDIRQEKPDLLPSPKPFPWEQQVYSKVAILPYQVGQIFDDKIT